MASLSPVPKLLVPANATSGRWFLHWATSRALPEGTRPRPHQQADGRANSVWLSPWVTCFSLTAFLILLTAAFFQSQLTSLHQELTALKMNLSSCGGKARLIRKRSSEGRETEGQTGAGVRAAHLEGSLPFQHIQNLGRIGPWSLSSTDDSLLRLRERSTELEISQSGVYYVYAQVYYLTSQLHNSFQVLSHNGTEDRRRHRNVATCSTQGRTSVGPASCYTGLVVSLRSGERLYLNQVEQDRVIQFSNGCSYFGVVLLKKNGSLKRKKRMNQFS